jgi:hypothetical protein
MSRLLSWRRFVAIPVTVVVFLPLAAVGHVANGYLWLLEKFALPAMHALDRWTFGGDR